MGHHSLEVLTLRYVDKFNDAIWVSQTLDRIPQDAPSLSSNLHKFNPDSHR